MVRSFKIVSTVALVVGIVAIAIGVTALVYSIGRPPPSNTIIIENSTHSTTTVNQAGPGSNLAGINQPLNATQLSNINNASSAYFEQAALMLLNGSIKNQISDSAPYVIKPVTPFKYGNKTTVVYLGSITCIFCGENRWAMALALSRFGNFTSLYTGYSSLGDGDVPTIYWLPDTVNSSNDVLGNHYASNQVDFVAIEDTNPISGGFQLNSLSTIQANIQKAN
ncbi:MAG: DUF929 family protein, partial [Candidatus Micrarchaeota archaeon]|nr:DUF929 family protein [Candidatus Micrarchaeota archaeon]